MQPRALQITAISSIAQAYALVPEWLDLYARSTTGNPYVHPAWVMSWYETCVAERNVLLLAVRKNAHLVGVLPFWLRRCGIGVVVEMVGAGRAGGLLDLPGLLVAPELERKVITAGLHWVLTEVRPSWCTLTLAANQGWIDPATPAPHAFVVPRIGRTSVVSRLGVEGSDFQDSLKRNVKESIRRANNRLNNSGLSWEIERRSPGEGEYSAALARLIELHRTRASLPGRKRHRDSFHGPLFNALIQRVGEQSGGAQHVSILSLRVTDRILAAQMVLNTPTAAVLGVSGLHPDGWWYSPFALLICEAARHAAAAGQQLLNHSVGPDIGKLRWSEHLETASEFSIVRSSGPGRLLFSGYSAVAALAAVRREQVRFAMNTPEGSE